MALAQTKQQEIMKNVREIEDILITKFKCSTEGTFGSKIKEVQDSIDNSFFVSSVWTLVQIRNALVHGKTGNEITLKEFKLFKSNYDYIKSVLPKTKLLKKKKK